MQALYILFFCTAFAQEPQPSSDVIEKTEEAASSEDVPKTEASPDKSKKEEPKTDVKEEKTSSKSSAVKSDKSEKKEDPKKEIKEDPVENLSVLVKAVQDKNWILAVAAFTMLLVFGFKKFGFLNKLPAKATPWVAIGIAVAATSGSAVLSGLPVNEAIIQGLIAGLSSAGIWSAAGKHILAGSPDEEEVTADG